MQYVSLSWRGAGKEKAVTGDKGTFLIRAADPGAGLQAYRQSIQPKERRTMKLRTTMKERINKFMGNVLRKSNNKGFTLLEILVVLTIMGFLIAMVAPRLGGVSSSAVDTVCDSNQSRTIQMVGAYFEKTNRFPDKLTNLVVANGATWEIPTVSDDNPENGKETLSSEFDNRVNPAIHHLSAAEVAELKGMGVVNVFNLNSYDNSSVAVVDQGTPMAKVSLTAGQGVMMSGGMGAVDAATDIAVAATDLTGLGEAEFVGRIVMGLGPESGLVTSGLVTNAAHCPGGLQNSDNVSYNDYNIVLPRLAATVARTTGITDRATEVDGTQFVGYAYTEDFAATGNQAATVAATTGAITNVPANMKVRMFDYVAQEPHQYATMCPEGHMFPADDTDFWAVDFDATNGVTINP
jgi:prepilin-type N-terminal cleavage/methylation domain-containing protein